MQDARSAAHATLLLIASGVLGTQAPPLAAAQAALTGSGPAPDLIRRQAYPLRPIRVINTVAAGGPAELVARVIGQKLTEAWGQQIVVDTRAGAAGTIGAEIVARATPDGYTLLLGSGATMVIAPLVQKDVPYDPIRDFAPVSRVVTSPFVLAAHPTLGAKTVSERRSSQSKAGAVQLRFSRRRQHGASGWRAIENAYRHRHTPRALQRRGARGCGPSGWADFERLIKAAGVRLDG